MSHGSIRRQIRKYESLKSEAEERLRKFEEELENLLAFKSRYEIGKEDFYNNMNHRKTRAENVNAMSHNIKAGKAYYEGMNEDLSGTRYCEAINDVDDIKYKINEVIRWLEDQIEKLKQQIVYYNHRISELNEHLSRKHDD